MVTVLFRQPGKRLIDIAIHRVIPDLMTAQLHRTCDAMNERLHPLLQQQISRYLPTEYLEKTDLNRFIDEVNKSCYSPLATTAPTPSATDTESAFLSIINHETRTPLNAIVGLLDLLQDEVMPPTWQDHLQTLRVSVDGMQLALSNLLDYRQINIGQLSVNMIPFAPRQLLDSLLNVNQHKVQGTGISIGLSVDDAVPMVIQGDPLRLSQVINNVLQNAISFVHSGHIMLRAERHLSSAGDVFILFAVDIPCDDPAQYAMLTNPAMQDESGRPEPFNGLGLALFVSQRLLRLCGSSLRVDRYPGQSITVSFTLPALDAPRPDVPPAQPNAQALSGMRVLMVEDYPINVRVASRFLARWQVVVDVAENGQVALDKYQASQYDLILMDVQMPVMDGLAATRAIRQFDTRIPIVALTASATPTDQANAYAAGMNSFLTKPFNADELFRTLLRHGRPAAA